MSRAEVVVAAAVRVLATTGSRGLTHRAVDAAADLPAGSTSNLFRTRRALVDAVVADLLARDTDRLTRLTEHEHASPGELLAAFVVDTLETRRDDVLARAALLADPDGAGLREARTALIALGTTAGASPATARLVVAALDGVLLDGALHGPLPDGRQVAELVDAVLGGARRA